MPEGDYTYILYRSKRNESESEFSYLDTWSARMDSREAVMNEENIPFLIIKLPVVQDDEWDGNLYNTMGEDTYVLEKVKDPFNANGTSYR